MKIRFHRFFIALVLLVIGNAGHAATSVFVWTNTAGGDWNNSTNWSPNQVPVSGGNVIITNPGTYTVTNTSGTTLGKLTLGGTNGIQTLTAASLTLTNASLVNSNGVLNWIGGDLEGSLTVEKGGALTVSNTVYFAQNNYSFGYTNTATLTNYGTVVWAGTIDGSANSTGGGGGMIYNAGLWDSIADNSTSYYGYNSPNNSFINTGTLEKVGGTGTTTINWNFASTGTINTSSGTFTLNWNGASTLHGNLSLASGTVITSLTVESNAVLNLSGGDLEGSLTVEQGGTLTLSNTVYFAQNNYSYGYTNTVTLTNYGTVVWAGTIDGSANSTGGGGGMIYNAGLWDSVADNSMGYYGYNSPNNSFINTGTLEKVGGTGTTTIGWNFNNNGGTVSTPSGLFSIGNWTGNGLVVGSANFSGGTVSGTIAPGAVMNFSSTRINGAMTVSSNAVANWNGGDLEGSLTVEKGGALTVSNTVYFAQNNYSFGYTNTATLTNYGTVVWAGTIDGSANSTGGGGGMIYNAGLWDSIADNSTSYYGYNSPNNSFINTGTLEKVGGTGTTTINWNFASTGTINTSSGTFTLNWNGASTLHGNLSLASGTVITSLTVESNAVLNLSGGDLEGSLTVEQGGTLTLSNTVYFAQNNYSYGYTNTVTLTNYGTVVWAGTIDGSANSTGGGGGMIYNAGLWDSVADNSMGYYGYNSPNNSFINTGTLEKVGGTGTTTIGWNFNNNGGILDSQTNTISLSGNYDFTGGTLNVGINSLTSYGVINLSSTPAVLTGTVSANLNNGYVPTANNLFSVLTYSSESGAFTNFNLPVAVVWQTNYGGTAFTLKVLGIQTNTAPNLLVNGDFESEPNWGGGVSYDGGETAFIGSQLPGWTIATNHAVTVHISPGPYLTISGNYSANLDGEGYDGNNANFYQDLASQSGASYALEFNWQSWGYVSTPTTSQLEVSVVDTVTSAVLFDGLYSYDGNGQPHPVHDVLANFVGTGHSLRLRIQETPQSGYNDNTFMVDNFSVTTVPSGLVAWWRAEGNALDSIGTNNGALVNGATFAPGKIGTAFSFGGSGDYVSVPSSPAVQQQNSITVGAWVFAQGAPASESGIAGTWDDLTGGNRTYLLWLASGRLEFLVSQDGGGYTRATDPVALPTNQWVYVVGTYDGNTIRLYHDGVQVASTPYSGQIHVNGRPFYIGRTDSGSNGSDYWKGQIDEVMIYNRALSSNEVASIYAAENGSGQPVAPVLTVSLSSGTVVTASASGHFVLASSPVVGGQPQSVAVADVNGDGRLDLMANGLNLTNAGDGGFGTNIPYSVGTFGSTCVVAADVNGDGKPDLITANYGNTTLTVLTNNGVGVFGSNATLEVNSSPQCVVASDVNGDGKPDLICASSSGARFLTVFTNNGAGGFGLSSTPANGNVRAYSVVATDVSGDGKTDLITANFTANTLSVFTNNGTGGFGLNATYAVGSQPRSVVVADVNGDNRPDLICANTGDGTVTVLTNNGGGVFVSNATYTVGSQPRLVVATDINADGRVDLICANAGDGTLTVLTNNGSGQFVLNATCTVGTAPYSLVTADVNGDGPVDLISANEGSGTLTVLTNMAVLETTPFKNVILSWPSPSTGFVLQQNSNLGVAGWLGVTNTPSVTNGQNQVAIPATPQNNFFRLLHP